MVDDEDDDDGADGIDGIDGPPADDDASADGPEGAHSIAGSLPTSGYLPRPLGRGDVPTGRRMSGAIILEVAMLCV
jgi:hypothetical protein